MLEIAGPADAVVLRLLLYPVPRGLALVVEAFTDMGLVVEAFTRVLSETPWIAVGVV